MSAAAPTLIARRGPADLSLGVWTVAAAVLLFMVVVPLAWILVAPHSGWRNRAWVALTGAPRGFLNIYSLAGAVCVIALYSYPYAFAFVSSALELVPAEMERSAELLGASWLRTTWRITLPLVRPAIIAGALMSFLEAIAEFGTPAFLLIPARQQVITTQLYLFFQYPSRPNLAAAYALPLLAVTASLFLLQQRLLRRGRFTTVSGKGGVRVPFRLGPWRWPVFAICMAPPIFSLILPYTALLATSLSHAWGRGPVPGIVLAIGFFAAYARPPLVLYGTAWMLIVAFATRFLPIAYAGSESALRSLDLELENAARTLGSGRLRTFGRITIPLLRRSILANWLMVFIPSLRELSSAVFLFTPATA